MECFEGFFGYNIFDCVLYNRDYKICALGKVIFRVSNNRLSF